MQNLRRDITNWASTHRPRCGSQCRTTRFRPAACRSGRGRCLKSSCAAGGVSSDISASPARSSTPPPAPLRLPCLPDCGHVAGPASDSLSGAVPAGASDVRGSGERIGEEQPVFGAPGRLASIVPRAARAPADDRRPADPLSAVASAQRHIGPWIIIDAPGHWQYLNGGLTAQRAPRRSLLLGQGHIRMLSQARLVRRIWNPFDPAVGLDTAPDLVRVTELGDGADDDHLERCSRRPLRSSADSSRSRRRTRLAE